MAGGGRLKGDGVRYSSMYLAVVQLAEGEPLHIEFETDAQTHAGLLGALKRTMTREKLDPAAAVGARIYCKFTDFTTADMTRRSRWLGELTPERQAVLEQVLQRLQYMGSATSEQITEAVFGSFTSEDANHQSVITALFDALDQGKASQCNGIWAHHD